MIDEIKAQPSMLRRLPPTSIPQSVQTQVIHEEKSIQHDQECETCAFNQAIKLEAENVELTEISSEASFQPEPLSFSNSSNQEYPIGTFLEPEFIYASSKYLYVKTQSHRVEVLDLASFTPWFSIEAKKAKCVIEINEIAYVGCWDSTIQIIRR